MAWNIEGTYFENCNCDVICPCISSPAMGPADNETCDVLLAFHVDSGAVEGTDVSGRTVVMVAQAPAVMSSGNWKAGLVIDNQATEEQAEALGRVFGGQLGGPPAALSPLIGEMLGIERAPIDYRNDGTRHAVKVGEKADIVIEDFVPHGLSEPMRLTGAAHPVASTLTVARSQRGVVNAFGLSFDNTGKNGHAAPISWRG